MNAQGGNPAAHALVDWTERADEAAGSLEREQAPQGQDPGAKPGGPGQLKVQLNGPAKQAAGCDVEPDMMAAVGQDDMLMASG